MKNAILLIVPGVSFMCCICVEVAGGVMVGAWDAIGYSPNQTLAFMRHQGEALLGLIAVWQIFEGDQTAKNYA